MPRRLMGALAALMFTAFAIAPTAAMPAADRGTATVVSPRYQDVLPEDQPLAEDELAGFMMPGLTPDNLTDVVLADIDAFWTNEFALNGNDYWAAGIVPVAETVYSTCGPFGPYDNPAAYCPLDDSVYVSLPLGQEIQNSVGDFAWITILAHEWGHHVQQVLGLTHELTIDRELQADCLSGAYAQRALVQGFLQEGDVTEAVLINMLSGDPIEMEETVEGAHGSSDYRVTAFMQGYFGGSPACLA